MSAVDAAYLVAVISLMLLPGPSHLLALSVSLRHGPRAAAATAAGDLTANAIQMILAGTGLSSLLLAWPQLLRIVQIAGVLALVWMGLRALTRRRSQDASDEPSPRIRPSGHFARGFLTSASNPKAVLFFAALFPQFLRPEQPLGPQLLALGAVYLVADATFLAGYTAFAGWLRRLEGRYPLDRLSGLVLLVAAVLLALKDLPR